MKQLRTGCSSITELLTTTNKDGSAITVLKWDPSHTNEFSMGPKSEPEHESGSPSHSWRQVVFQKRILATIYRFMRTNDCEHKGYVVGVVSIRMALDLDP